MRFAIANKSGAKGRARTRLSGACALAEGPPQVVMNWPIMPASSCSRMWQ